MDFDNALRILGIELVANYDAFRLKVSKYQKTLLIKSKGSNDKEASKINRAYDLLKKISIDEFNQIIN